MTSVRKAAGNKVSGVKASKPRKPAVRTGEVDLPFADSVGYQIRATHRALQRFLSFKIEPHGITAGMWYFLRALWHEDGLTQRELSTRVGTMEPTTVVALRSMEKSGLIRRVRSRDDKRRSQVWLTPKAQRLRDELLALARSITDAAEHGISRADLALFRRVIRQMTVNLDRITM